MSLDDREENIRTEIKLTNKSSACRLNDSSNHSPETSRAERSSLNHTAYLPHRTKMNVGEKETNLIKQNENLHINRFLLVSLLRWGVLLFSAEVIADICQ